MNLRYGKLSLISTGLIAAFTSSKTICLVLLKCRLTHSRNMYQTSYEQHEAKQIGEFYARTLVAFFYKS